MEMWACICMAAHNFPKCCRYKFPKVLARDDFWFNSKSDVCQNWFWKKFKEPHSFRGLGNVIENIKKLRWDENESSFVPRGKCGAPRAERLLPHCCACAAWMMAVTDIIGLSFFIIFRLVQNHNWQHPTKNIVTKRDTTGNSTSRGHPWPHTRLVCTARKIENRGGARAWKSSRRKSTRRPTPSYFHGSRGTSECRPRPTKPAGFGENCQGFGAREPQTPPADFTPAHWHAVTDGATSFFVKDDEMTRKSLDTKNGNRLIFWPTVKQ